MNAIANTAVTVLNAAAALDAVAMRTLGGGKFVTAQLGNPGDVTWSPCATILILKTEAAFFGQQFSALYKKKNGQYYIAQMVELHPVIRKTWSPEEQEEGTEQALMYCTCAKPWDMDTMSSKYMSAGEIDNIHTALRMHKAKVDQLPVIEEFNRDGKVE